MDWFLNPYGHFMPARFDTVAAQKSYLFVTRKGMVERGKRKYHLLNLMIAIMILENLKLRITMRERAMQTLIKRSSWMVGGKERGKKCCIQIAKQEWLLR